MNARMNHPIDAVLFDLDGTLIDSAPDLAGAANDLRPEHLIVIGIAGLLGAEAEADGENGETDDRQPSCIHMPFKLNR